MSGIIQNNTVIARFVTPTSILSNQPAFVSDSISLKRTTVKQNIQRWEITTSIEPTNDSAEFLLSSLINGYTEVFEIQVPQIYRLNGKNKTTSTSNPTTTVFNSANANTIIIANNNGIISKGEFIKFANHSKVYVVTETLNGNGNLKIYPNLVNSVPETTVVNYGSNVRMQVRYDLNTLVGITYIDGILADPGTVTLIEAL
jgi:hypothetical protein